MGLAQSQVLKNSLIVVSLICAGNFIILPVHAQSALRGAGVIIRPSGSSQSLAIEVVADSKFPLGYFETDVTPAVVRPSFTEALAGTNQESFQNLQVDATFQPVTNPISQNPIFNSIATQIDLAGATTVEDVTTLIRAVGGVNGLD